MEQKSYCTGPGDHSFQDFSTSSLGQLEIKRMATLSDSELSACKTRVHCECLRFGASTNNKYEL